MGLKASGVIFFFFFGVELIYNVVSFRCMAK